MPATAAESILVVEDDNDMRDTLVSVLRNQGYRADAVATGAAALEYLRAGGNPSLIVLDLMMPGMNGWTFRAEQKKDPSLSMTPVVVVTADDSPQARAIDADAFLCKPFDVQELLDEITTTLKRTRAKREALAERMVSLGTMAAGMAHEINNPLAYVLGNLATLNEHVASYAKPEKRAELETLVSEALEGAERIRDVVRQAKLFSNVRDEVSAVDPNAAVRAAIRLTRNVVEHRAKLVEDCRPVPAVAANEGKLVQVLTNILQNAAQACAEVPDRAHEIRVITEPGSEGQVVVRVRDTGCGMDAAVARRVFDPFFTTKHEAGTGLGLSICYGVVKSWGGEIRVDTQRGKGTTFSVFLPSATAEHVETVVREPDQQPVEQTASLRVLVVDDEPAICRALTRVLKRHHQAVACGSGDEALALLKRDSAFDAILCDLMMPGLNGMDLFEVVQQGWPALASRMVFTTGGAFSERAERFLARCENPCLLKPVDRDQLLELLREIGPCDG